MEIAPTEKELVICMTEPSMSCGFMAGRGDMPQLLPPVGDPIDGPGFVERGIHRLETGDEGQKSLSETQPELHDDEDRHDILLGRKPKDRLVDQPEVHQDRVGVAAESEEKINFRSYRRCRISTAHRRPGSGKRGPSGKNC